MYKHLLALYIGSKEYKKALDCYVHKSRTAFHFEIRAKLPGVLSYKLTCSQDVFFQGLSAERTIEKPETGPRL